MTVRLSYVKRLFAGAVFGVYMAYLLFFLNPQLAVTPGRIVAAALIYAVICGVLFGTLLFLVRVVRVKLFGRGEGAAVRHGFGTIAIACAAAAATYWAHLYLLRIYLPRGAIRVLSKATLIIAATFLLLFLLWLLERNASRVRSRWLLAIGVLAVVASSFFLYQRREGYRSADREVVEAQVERVSAEEKIVVVAVRALPYDWVLTLVGEGLLPNLKALMASGYTTRVEPFRTTSQKAIWASLATGQLPHRHGVTGRFAYITPLNRPGEKLTLVPSGVGFRGWGLIPPVERVAAQLPAGESLPFWSFYERVGFAATVINWPGAISGSAAHVVSDRVVRRIEPARDRAVRRLVDSARLDLAIERRLSVLAAAPRAAVAAACRSDLVATRLAMGAGGRSHLTALALNGLSESLVALRDVDNTLPERGTAAGDAIRTHLHLIDQLVGELWRANEDAAFVLVSPSAADPPAQPISIAALLQIAIDVTDPGRNDGFVVMSGRQFATRANPESAEVADIVPTLLYATRLPLARDLDGKIITEAISEDVLRTAPLTMIPSYEAGKFVVR